jgi:hypothetical protein
VDDLKADIADIVQKVDDVINGLTIKEELAGVKSAEFQIVKSVKDRDDDILFRGSDESANLKESEPCCDVDESVCFSKGLNKTYFEEESDVDRESIRFSIRRNGEEEEVIVEPEIDTETVEIYAKVEAYVKLLRLKGIELAVIHEFIDKQEPLSPLVITDDLRIYLPLYNNIEIELSAQKKALYFLFLNHPEGIVLQHLEEYHNELVNYYKQTNKGILTPKMEESIKKLEAYGNNQLNVLIARIREAFCLKFDEHLARNYFISGEKGQPYRIPLNPQLDNWVE